MVESTTRIVPQAVYAARESNTEVAPKDMPRLTQNVLVKQGLLATAFPHPAASQAVLGAMQTKHPLAGVVTALHEGRAAAVAPQLAATSMADVVEFARSALTAEQDLLGQATTVLATVKPASYAANDPGSAAAGQTVMTSTTPAAALTAKAAQSSTSVPLAVQVSLQPNVGRYLQALGVTAVIEPAAQTMAPSLVAQWSVAATVQTQRIARRISALEALVDRAQQDPIGYLYLDRLEMTPGQQKQGEFLHSITMLPNETIRFTHRQWTRTQRDFSSAVTDSVEQDSEQTLSEKSELTESTASQQSQSMAFSASLSGGTNLGVVNIAANAGFNIGSQQSNTVQTNAQHSRELTRKASSRVKHENKVTVSISVSSETEDTNYREVTNSSSSPVRFDFYGIQRGWDVRLVRHGIRLCYEVILPEPGSYLMRLHERIHELSGWIEAPFHPPALAELTPNTAAALANRYNVAIDPPPEPLTVSGSTTVPLSGDNNSGGSGSVALSIPAGYYLSANGATAHAIESTKDSPSSTSPGTVTSSTNVREAENKSRLSAGFVTDTFHWNFDYFWHGAASGNALTVYVDAVALPLQATVDKWRAQAYSALTEALRAQYFDQTAIWSRERDELRAELDALDTLTLRRLEHEEIVKGVLRWILGPGFNFYPQDLPRLAFSATGITDDIDTNPVDNSIPGLYDPVTGAVTDSTVWQAELAHGRIISFIHQAAEWENVGFVLYPYFWTDHSRWDFKQRLQHADEQHTEFLRAGAARVVVPIRRGFEAAWTHFVDTGQLAGGPLDPATPYMQLAAEIEAAAAEYGASRSPAGDDVDGVPQIIGEWQEWTPTGALDVVLGEPLSS